MSHPLLAGTDSATRHVLRQAGEVAADLGLPLYLVGGSVRDALLGHSHLDCDLVTEGSALDLATALAERWRVPVALHERFMTASLRHAGGTPVDVTTARCERYPVPGALPEVTPASITQDLWRRDFGVNAMAVAIPPAGDGRLLDPTGGCADLGSGAIRALHARSFWDDATRIVRAAAFEQRLDMSLAPATSRWLVSAGLGGALQTVSGQRLRDALLPALSLPAGPRVLRRLAHLGLLGPVLGAAAPAPRDPGALTHLEDAIAHLAPAPSPRARTVACLAALVAGRVADPALLASHLHLDHHLTGELRSAAEALQRWPGGFVAPSRDGLLVQELREASWGAATALWLLTPSQHDRDALRHYWLELRLLRPDVTAADLLEQGVPRGPGIGHGLRAALEAKLDTGADAAGQLQTALGAALPGSHQSGPKEDHLHAPD